MRQSCPCRSGVGLSGLSQVKRKTPDSTIVFILEPDPPATTTGRTLVSRKLPADHGNNATVFALVMVRTKRDLHLFKHSTFTFILDESIPGQKLSLWAFVHRSRTLRASGATRTPQPRAWSASAKFRHEQNRTTVPIPRPPAAVFRPLTPTLNSRFSPSAHFGAGNSARSQEGAEERDARAPPYGGPAPETQAQHFKCTNSIPSALKPGLPQLPPPDLPCNGSSLKDLKVDAFQL